MKDIKLTDLIPPNILQQFQDGFSKFTGMAALITDENGTPVKITFNNEEKFNYCG